MAKMLKALKMLKMLKMLSGSRVSTLSGLPLTPDPSPGGQREKCSRLADGLLPVRQMNRHLQSPLGPVAHGELVVGPVQLPEPGARVAHAHAFRVIRRQTPAIVAHL